LALATVLGRGCKRVRKDMTLLESVCLLTRHEVRRAVPWNTLAADEVAL